MDNQILVKVDNLKKYFPVYKGLLSKVSNWVKAVDGVSFSLRKGETLGLVGESGCGKTTVGRSILRLIEPSGGEVVFAESRLNDLPPEKLRVLRRKMQIIFQDPYSSLNPRMTAGDIIGEALLAHRICGRKEKEMRVKELMERVGLSPSCLNWYPHEFSGGMRQRIGIARALVLRPDFIVCDEPVSALDVSIQAQILNLLGGLKEELNITYLFISHDLSVVKHISNRIAVMYLGKVVELAESNQLYKNPRHPYTQILFSAIPKLYTGKERKQNLKGEVPSALNPPSGCHFHPRCPLAQKICSEKEPPLEDKGGGHLVACHTISI